MATNPYFSYKVRAEQQLYEDIVIEALKMYGQDVYYIPREVISKDTIFNDTILSRFNNAYKIEMYIENMDGFDGEGDLFTKFGVEIRDAATFILARRRWNQTVGRLEGYDSNKFYRPREGDVIYLPLSQTTFQIMSVQSELPFYQVSDLPVFKLRCEVFEYSDEDFDTGIDEIDRVEEFAAYQYVLTMDSASTGFDRNETITQTFDNYSITGEVVRWSDSDLKLYVAHIGSSDGLYRDFTTTRTLTGSESSAVATPTLVQQLQNIQESAKEVTFDASTFEFIDFSESNPFGDPQ